MRHNSVAEGYHPDEELARIEPVNPDVSGFPESVARVKGYKRIGIRNGF